MPATDVIRLFPSPPSAAGPARDAASLLAATNLFLTSPDVHALGHAVVAAAASLFAPDKVVLVLTGPDGRRQPVAHHGLDDVEQARVEASLAALPGIREEVLNGRERWSDGPDGGVLRSRLEPYACRSGFVVPVVTTGGPIGSLTVMYLDERPFGPEFRSSVRSLCAQAALAVELIETRQALERQRAVATALFSVSQELATIGNTAEIPARLAAAIRAATGASYAIVGRWDAAAGRLSFDGAAGFDARGRELLDAVVASPDRFRMIRGGLEGRANVRTPPFDPEDVPVELVGALRLTSIAGSSITVDGKPWGVIAVGTTEGDPDIVATGADLLTGFATVAATAIGRAEAITALAAQAAQLESAIATQTVQLREAVDELRRASQAKTELLANVSHELRTPLTAILGFSEILLQRLDGPLTLEQLEDVRTIGRSGRHLLELIDDLIDVSRIDAGRVELRTEPVDVEALVRGTAEEIRPLAGGKGLLLEVIVEPTDTQIEADPARVHEILLNLLDNAVKFTPPGGRVEVTARGDGNGLTVVVADAGIGIAREHQGLVFEKFHRVAGPEYAGTGLGLAIAREYARLHGGDLTLESVLGHGSRFTLWLPARPATPPPAPAPARRPG